MTFTRREIITSNKHQDEEMEQIMQQQDMDFIQIDYAIDEPLAAERILPLAAHATVHSQAPDDVMASCDHSINFVILHLNIRDTPNTLITIYSKEKVVCCLT